MPEGDTVWRTARRLDQALAGHLVVRSDLRWPGLSTADLTGRATLEVVSRGKHLLHRLQGGLTLHSHLRMEGQWRIEATATLKPGWRRSPDLRALVGSDDWTALGLRLGRLDLIETAREDDIVGHLGPDLLGPDWDPTRAVDNLVASAKPLAAALLDQRNLAGLGTMWVAETLFALRIHPWLSSAGLDRSDLERVVDVAQRFLDRSRRDPEAAWIDPRVAGPSVHGRSGRPCRRCGGTIRVASTGAPPRERAIFYCPSCQGGLGPTDDGRPQAPLGSRAGRSPRARSSGR